jgi:hypothetical protein
MSTIDDPGMIVGSVTINPDPGTRHYPGPVFKAVAQPNIGTHWEGCWRDPSHHACAVARCEQLRIECSVARRWARVWKRFARKMWRKNRGLSQKER